MRKMNSRLTSSRARARAGLVRRCFSVGLFGFLLQLGHTRAVAAEGARPRRVLRLEAVKIEGRIQKPQAFYILQRSNLNFEGLELKRSFIPKIIESVDQPPF